MHGDLMVLVALQIGPYAVPKGTVVHVGLYTMHRGKRWWEDAEAFKPERWVGNETGGDKSGGLAYMPFGLGPRKCIGYKLAGILAYLEVSCSCCHPCSSHMHRLPTLHASVR